jgi:hypothetical protein
MQEPYDPAPCAAPDPHLKIKIRTGIERVGQKPDIVDMDVREAFLRNRERCTQIECVARSQIDGDLSAEPSDTAEATERGGREEPSPRQR